MGLDLSPIFFPFKGALAGLDKIIVIPGRYVFVLSINWKRIVKFFLLKMISFIEYNKNVGVKVSVI